MEETGPWRRIKGPSSGIDPQLWEGAGVMLILKTEIRQPALAEVYEWVCVDLTKMRRSDSILSDEIPLLYKIICFRRYKLNKVFTLCDLNLL